MQEHPQQYSQSKASKASPLEGLKEITLVHLRESLKSYFYHYMSVSEGIDSED